MSNAIKLILADDKLLTDLTKVAFESVDTDKTGKIDHNKLKQIMKQISADMGADQPSEEDIRTVLKQLDTDKSGKVELKEFKILIKDILEGMLRQASTS